MSSTLALRNSGFPRGRVTEELKAEFERRGGEALVVVDPNDDLATLGDPWPTPPKGWGAAQERDARRTRRRLVAGRSAICWTC